MPYFLGIIVRMGYGSLRVELMVRDDSRCLNVVEGYQGVSYELIDDDVAIRDVWMTIGAKHEGSPAESCGSRVGK